MTYLGPLGFSVNRLEDACEFHGDSYLNWTPSAPASDLQTGTISTWFRRVRWGAQEYLWSAYASSVSNTNLLIDSSNRLAFDIWAGSYTVRLISTETVADNNWNHATVRLDLSNATQANRARMYLGEDEVTYTTETRPGGTSSDAEGLFEANAHNVGRYGGASSYFRGLMADINFVQGLSLGPENFGKTVDSAWVWKDYTGSHGTNGQRFQFANPADLGANTAT